MMKKVDKAPKGWILNKAATTTPVGYDMYVNNESLFSGKRKRVLVKKKY